MILLKLIIYQRAYTAVLPSRPFLKMFSPLNTTTVGLDTDYLPPYETCLWLSPLFWAHSHQENSVSKVKPPSPTN